MTVFFVLILSLLVYNIPFPIQKSYDAIEINMADENIKINRTIKINGYYHLNLFSNDTFTGLFEISGYEHVVKDYEFRGVEISRSGEPLCYINSESNISEQILFGNLYAGFMFRNMIIGYVIDENGNNNSTFTCNAIVTNADTRQSAYEATLKTFNANGIQ